MLRYTSRAVLASGVVIFTAGLTAGPAAAGPAAAAPQASPPPMLTSRGLPGRRVTVDIPVERSLALATALATPISTTLYLERCKGGCTVQYGPNDARTNTSMIPMNAVSTIREFANSAGMIGSAADAEWGQIVRCMKEVYSPYNVVVTDVKPTSGQRYHEAIIAGQPEAIGLGSDILGIAQLAGDCRAIDDVISFTFASNHPAMEYVLNICWTAAQESAHAYGLDHEYSFPTNVSFPDTLSACNDPMTYRSDCGGQKFFRNEAARCGEETARPCKCGTSQNSHMKLLSVFGAGKPITARPTIALRVPAASDGALDHEVTADAGAQRGVARVELYFNGFKWGAAPGMRFLLDGQPDPGTYSIAVPAALPDSIVDVKTIAFDDLEIASESTVVTVTKGAPCATADTCAKGQKCEAGKCFWDPPSGEIGDSCSYPQFCKSLLCQDAKGQQICTQACDPGVAGSCPSGFACMASGTPGGSCFPAASTGRGDCSADRGGQGWLMYGGIAATLLGLLARRRRR
jgi:hypothetical protein